MVYALVDLSPLLGRWQNITGHGRRSGWTANMSVGVYLMLIQPARRHHHVQPTTLLIDRAARIAKARIGHSSTHQRLNSATLGKTFTAHTGTLLIDDDHWEHSYRYRYRRLMTIALVLMKKHLSEPAEHHERVVGRVGRSPMRCGERSTIDDQYTII